MNIKEYIKESCENSIKIFYEIAISKKLDYFSSENYKNDLENIIKVFEKYCIDNFIKIVSCNDEEEYLMYNSFNYNEKLDYLQYYHENNAFNPIMNYELLINYYKPKYLFRKVEPIKSLEIL